MSGPERDRSAPEAAAAASDKQQPATPLLLPLYWLLALALLYTLYVAKSLLMPIVVALLFALLLSPLVTLGKRFHVPRTLSALFLLAMIGGPFSLLVIELAAPAQKWLARLPQLSAQLTEELDALSETLRPPAAREPAPEQQETGFSFFGLFADDDETPPAAEKSAGDSALSQRVMQGGVEIVVSILGAAPLLLAQFFTGVILVLFLLVFGPRLYNSFVDIFPMVRDKRRATLLVGRVQKELSRYIVTVSLINTLLGLVTGSALWILGVEDALLWGALVGLLNFAPYVGPLVGIGILCLAGVSQYGLSFASLLPAGIYFGFNLLESQFLTPMVLGRHMRLNPLVLILWLLVWGWLWGPVGVLLAVPLLVCLKLAAGQLHVLEHWVALIETRA